MTLWADTINQILPGDIFQVRKGVMTEIETCDKLRLVKIMAQTQNWNCTEEEAADRIKQSDDEHPFFLGDEEFFYEPPFNITMVAHHNDK